ncbi:2-oxoglutarate dehydrogenase E1 component [Marinomonas primoryensis]|jgi:2-oxoglutarate dehydrogenase E1 component|uniref:2-oxoglutarate dehydrogenase E1 component n=1 Tax=Marinomonas primoryensis TaxID=178399 RepID=A0A2Z4PUH9_9GAMM|nr:2-oxoglutarate dehydrogenase E1 component [Marinomonas primoryensis]AWY01268.1 2-oxoglutarate dehydrogenase E1 component [Marinomonas primoryensis]QKK80141.1 2-oxoglutarate dehydrogenase subunit E1 [Marinomonas primoryensis]|tara:strand:+ start:22974 stop:25811 length:2838 start_codon:yes stop_codon:yes gene_type:complete
MHESLMELLWSTSHFSGGNLEYVEGLFESYLVDPNSVSEEWRKCFDQLPRVSEAQSTDLPHSVIQEQFLQIGKNKFRSMPVSSGQVASSDHEQKQINVLQLINAYRVRGHQHATLDPLGLQKREKVADLDIGYHQLTGADLDTKFNVGSLFFNKESLKLSEIISELEKTYCESIGYEFMHIVDTQEKAWLQQRVESVRSHPEYSQETRESLLERLTAAEGLEKYLASRYPGAKRFGLEGAESLIPMVNELIQRSGALGAKEVVIGMAHRGRLNVLINTLGKNPKDLFDEFEGKKLVNTSGDVKYHQGFSSNVITAGGEVHIALSFNPSHLEIVSPVVEGSVRARQDRRKDTSGKTVVPISIHGDAAFAGQGVVMETFQMSQTRAYRTGGTVHIVINNQVGFTTNRQEDSRSTEYATDVAKIIQAPIFHVNGDDPEAVLFVTQLALDYRYEFGRDVVIDMVCYRRRGHNETDEPSGTQPLMYSVISKLKTTRTLYSERLVGESVVTQEKSDQMVIENRDDLDNARHVAKSLVLESQTGSFVDWKPYIGVEWTDAGDTTFPLSQLQSIAKKLTSVPDGIVIQRQVQKIYQDRDKMTAGALPLNWGYAEILAFATLLEQGYPIRITGQDSGRGTFSHRHAVIHSQKDGSTYIPLKHLSEDQPTLDLYDSYLSEEAVLAFEYGYASTSPKGLVIWEAQFGDFANGAQVVIDQFITSGEHKWGRLCGLTMLLPHGYEGQGPEHSSARLERFLQLCAEYNIQVCVPTTPSQIFHIIRRQAIRPMRRPLIIMSPKSLLRHKQAISTLEDLAEGSFKTVLPESSETVTADSVKRIVLCSGKVYFDLINRREELQKDDVAVIRLEQLYPFPYTDLESELEQYKNVESLVWCQEEPKNQGAWHANRHRMNRVLEKLYPELKIRFAGRISSAAPAAGYMSIHVEEQEALVNDALVG